MKNVLIALSVLIGLCPAYVSVEAKVVELDATISVTSFPGNERMKHYTRIYRKMAKQGIADGTATATFMANYEMAASEGFQYSYPVKFTLDIDTEGDINRYRVDYFEPVIRPDDPAFKPSKPAISYMYRVTVIVNAKNRYEQQDPVDGGPEVQWIHDISGFAVKQPESWIPALARYRKIRDESPISSLTTTTGTVSEYDLYGGLQLTESDDGRSVLMIFGEPESPEYAARFVFPDSTSFPFRLPSVYETKRRDRLVVCSLGVPQTLAPERGEDVLTIPDVDEENE